MDDEQRPDENDPTAEDATAPTAGDPPRPEDDAAPEGPGASDDVGPDDTAPDGPGAPDDVPPGEAAQATTPAATPPERLCRRCSTVTASTGEFCPHCGASYVRRRRLPRLPAMRGRTRRLVLALVVLILVGGAGMGVVLKTQADQRAEDRDRAAQRERAAERRERERRADAEATAAQEAEDAAAEEERLERRLRTVSVRELRKAVTKDARSRHAEGVLEDRASSTDCENTDGNEDDLDETTAEYSCIAITDTTPAGQSSGYRFTARMDFEDGSFTWHLGD